MSLPTEKRLLWKILNKLSWDDANNLLMSNKDLEEVSEEYWQHRLRTKFPENVDLKPDILSFKDWVYLLEHYHVTSEGFDKALLKEDLLALESFFLLEINPNVEADILFKKNLNQSLSWWISKEYPIQVDIDEYTGPIDPFITWAESGSEEEQDELFFMLANSNNAYIVYNVLMKLAKMDIWPNEQLLHEIMSASRNDSEIRRYISYLNELEYPFDQSLLNAVCKYLDFELVEKIAIRSRIKPDFNALAEMSNSTPDDFNRFMDRWHITEVDDDLFHNLILKQAIELLDVLAKRSILPPSEYINLNKHLEYGDHVKKWLRSKGLLE